jgi:hypothetical protein
MKTNYFRFMILSATILFVHFSSFAQINESVSPPTYRSNTDPIVAKESASDVHHRMVQSGLSTPENWSVEKFMPNSKVLIDNKGTEFWLLMERNYDTYVTGIYLDITSDFTTTGYVEIPGLAFYQDFTANPGEITRVELPADVQVMTSEVIENKGIHVVSQQEVAVYGVSLKQYTSDAYLGLPLDILSTQYLVMSYPNLTWYSSYVGPDNLSQFAIVSPYDNVVVTITPSCDTYTGQLAGVPFQITLNQGEAYQVQGYASVDPIYDLTGTVIQSTLPVAVFGGNACASIPTDYAACDHIVEQIPPTSTWGSYFVTYPLEGRENGDTWRILASSDNTMVYIDGANVATLNFGDFYEIILAAPAEIESTNPVLVMQYANGDDFDPNLTQNGDPFMMLIPPSEQFMTHYTFATPSSGFIYNYVTVTIETAGIGTLLLDGVNVEPGLFTAIGATGYSGAGLAIGAGSHTLENTANYPFGIYSYGFADYDSYGYAGGLSLEFIYEGSAPIIVRTQETIDLENAGQVENSPITISASITDPEAPYTQVATLFYKKEGQSAFTQVNFTEGNNSIWSAVIPAADVVTPGVFYYIYASDGQLASTNPAIDPSNNPYSIAILPNVLPVITHTPVTTAPLNQGVVIMADVTDNTNLVESVTLYYRNMGGNPVYNFISMMQTVKGTYEGTIPAAYILEQGTEYYIRAADDFGMSSTFYTSDNPIQINGPMGYDDLASSTNPHLSVYPNPTNGITNITIHVENQAAVSVKVLNTLGEEIVSLIDKTFAPGIYQQEINLKQLQPGCYFCILKYNDSIETIRLIIMGDHK